jgi:hypothetical protein
MSSFYKSAFYRHLMRHSEQRLLGDILLNAADLEAHSAGLYSGNPKLRLALAFAHPRFQRLRTNRFMRKDSDIDLTFAMEKMSSSDSTGLNLPRGNPTAFENLQAVLAKSHIIASRGIAFHNASLALAMLNSFRHHRHLSISFTKTITVLQIAIKANFNLFARLQPGPLLTLERQAHFLPKPPALPEHSAPHPFERRLDRQERLCPRPLHRRQAPRRQGRRVPADACEAASEAQSLRRTYLYVSKP